MKSKFKVLLLYVALFAVIFFAVTVLFGNNTNAEKNRYDQVKELFEEHRVVSAYLTNRNVLQLKVIAVDKETGEWKKVEGSDAWMLTSLEYRIVARTDVVKNVIALMEEAHNYDNALPDNDPKKLDYTYDYQVEEERPWWLDFLPYIIIMVIGALLWFFMMRQATGGGKGGRGINSFGKARVKTPAADGSKVRFADVAGADEEKAELEEVVEFLKNPGRFQKLGAKIPHGVLLVGPPGTGKTLLAKAVAGEAGVPFFSISGSDFVEMYVGVGASRVRDLFETARKAPASIVFIDEIDAVGRHRGAGLGGGHDEREQTLNQLLVEMDGFGSHDGIIVIAATNRPDILDPALLRPGRFDRQVTVNYPDLRGREAILRVHVRNKPLEGGVDLSKIAQSTAGFTGADLANLLNEAALLAARNGKNLIGMEEIEKATLKVMVGNEKKSSRLSEQEKKNTAYHEAGHAILSHLLPTQDPVRRISIIPAGRALGYTLSVPEEDKFNVYKSELCEKIAMLLGGRAAEELIFGDVSGGASNDIQRATHIAQSMVTRYGMSEKLGTVLLGGDHSDAEVFLGRDFNSSKNYSDQTAHLIDSEIKRFIDEGYALAKKILTENMDKLHFIAAYLAKHEVMDGEQFLYVMENETVTDEDLLSMVDKRRRQSDEENRAAEDEKKASEEVNEDIDEDIDEDVDEDVESDEDVASEEELSEESDKE